MLSLTKTVSQISHTQFVQKKKKKLIQGDLFFYHLPYCEKGQKTEEEKKNTDLLLLKNT